jgi:alkylation response protein AidB-like acyl-CoA dehydrogenase
MQPHMPGLRSPTPRQREIVSLAGTLAARFAERAEVNDIASIFPHENYGPLHETGYLNLFLPERLGGQGASVFDMVLGQEILARGCASTALVAAMHFSLLGRVIDAQAWPDDVLRDICAVLTREGGTINNCVTETELGSISRGGLPSMQAERVKDGWLLTGRKIFVTGAPVLRFLATAVVLPPSDAAPQGELVSALVDGKTPGLRVENTWNGSLGLRGCGNDDVVYENVFVPDHRIVEPTPIGGPRRPQGGSAWALPLAAGVLGVAQAALDTASHYANNRVPAALGQPIGTQPHIQQWIGEMAVKIQAARAVLHDTARACVAGEIAPDDMAGAVAPVTETALRVAGGFSMTRSLPLERYFRDARGGLFQPPQDDLALMLVGRTALAAENSRAECD